MLRDKFNWVVLFEGQMRGAYGIEDGWFSYKFIYENPSLILAELDIVWENYG